MGDPVTRAEEEAEAPNPFFASVSSGKSCGHTARGAKGKAWEKEEPPAVGQGQGQGRGRNWEVPKSVGPDETHPRGLRELGGEAAQPLPLRLEKSWQCHEAPADGKRGNVTPDFQNRKIKLKIQGSPGLSVPPLRPSRSRSGSRWKLPGHTENREVVGDSQRGVTEGKSSLSELVAACNGVTALVVSRCEPRGQLSPRKVVTGPFPPGLGRRRMTQKAPEWR